MNEDFSNFYREINEAISEKKFEETKELLVEFIASNPGEHKAISLFLDCLIELKQFEEIDEFINSLEEEIKNNNEIKQSLKKIDIIKNNQSGPTLENLLSKLDNNPKNINLILEISDKYFSEQDYINSFEILLKNYLKIKIKSKIKWLNFLVF